MQSVQLINWPTESLYCLHVATSSPSFLGSHNGSLYGESDVGEDDLFSFKPATEKKVVSVADNLYTRSRDSCMHAQIRYQLPFISSSNKMVCSTQTHLKFTKVVSSPFIFVTVGLVFITMM